MNKTVVVVLNLALLLKQVNSIATERKHWGIISLGSSSMRLPRKAAHKGKIDTCCFRIVLFISMFLSFTFSGGSLGAGATPSAFDRFLVSTPPVGQGQSATLLPDGRWLYIGGMSAGTVSADVTTSLASVNDVNKQLTSSLKYPRTNHSATVLPDGTVFVFGGIGPLGETVIPAEIIDPISGSITAITNTGLTPRSLHSAFLLTDGRLLITGGKSADGQPSNNVEVWNPTTKQSEPVDGQLAFSRFNHRGVLLSNGKGLVWGGQSLTGPISESGELFDPLFNSFAAVDPFDQVSLPSQYSASSLLEVAGSYPEADAQNVPVDAYIALRFSRLVNVNSVNDQTITLIGPAGSVGGKVVPAEGGLLLFFKPSIQLSPSSTYTLFANGVVDAGGIVLPFFSLSFTTQYFTTSSSVSTSSTGVQGLGNGGASKNGGGIGPGQTNAAGRGTSQSSVPPGSAGGTISPNANVDPGPEDWNPGPQHRGGNWRVLGMAGEPFVNVNLPSAAPLSAPLGITALSGRVVRLNGQPLKGVAVTVANVTVRTDQDGNFLLSGIPAGDHEMLVDGSTVSSGNRRYLKHYIRVTVLKGVSTPLPHTVFLARLNPASEVTIPSPTDREIILSHPDIPGLEIHIPKGAIVRDRDGKIVTTLSITPLPVDRAPFPMPDGFPVYLSVQPAGAYISNIDPAAQQGMRVIYPNYLGAAPGTTARFWNYDPAGGEWQVYGYGSISADGTQVVPDPGVEQLNLMAFGWGLENTSNAPAVGPAPGGCGGGASAGGCSSSSPPNPSACAGDPVDCGTGLFIHRVTDLVVQDIIPIVITRTYRQNDTFSRNFGIGTNHGYGIFLHNPTGALLPSVLDVILSDGGRLRFNKISGTSVADVVYQHSSSPTSYQGATIRISQVTHSWELTRRDKSVLIFSPHSPNVLTGIRDRHGNTLTIKRLNGSGNIQRITSPSGRYVDFTYDAKARSKYPPAEPGAFDCEPLEAAKGVANAAPHFSGPPWTVATSTQ